MIINKPFEELKQIFNDEKLREKLISKKYLIDFKKIKITEINIDESLISCNYSPDTRYSYILKFKKTNDGLIDFSVRLPSLIVVILIGGIMGLRFIDDYGIKGIFLGIFLLFLVSLLFKRFIANGVKSRIIKNWNNTIITENKIDAQTTINYNLTLSDSEILEKKKLRKENEDPSRFMPN